MTREEAVDIVLNHLKQAEGVAMIGAVRLAVLNAGGSGADFLEALEYAQDQGLVEVDENTVRLPTSGTRQRSP